MPWNYWILAPTVYLSRIPTTSQRQPVTISGEVAIDIGSYGRSPLAESHLIPLFFISETMYEILQRIIAKRVTLLWRYENIR